MRKVAVPVRAALAVEGEGRTREVLELEAPELGVVEVQKFRKLVAKRRMPPGASRRRVMRRMRSAWSRWDVEGGAPHLLRVAERRRVQPR